MGQDQGVSGSNDAVQLTPWDALSEFATRLADAGHLVAQILHCGHIPVSEWSHDSHTAALHSNHDADCVVTSDGVRHTP